MANETMTGIFINKSMFFVNGGTPISLDEIAKACGGVIKTVMNAKVENVNTCGNVTIAQIADPAAVIPDFQTSLECISGYVCDSRIPVLTQVLIGIAVLASIGALLFAGYRYANRAGQKNTAGADGEELSIINSSKVSYGAARV